jgi:predicted DNA-binding transcriptional regulator AlpA
MSSPFGMSEHNDFVTTDATRHSLVNIAMARQLALPPTLAPRLISREASAAYVSVSPTTFDEMVQDGRMPHPKRLGERRHAWDVRELDAAVDQLPSVGKRGRASDETWSDVDAPQTSAVR